MKKKTVSFIIPCYNSEKTIGNVVNEIKTSLKNQYNYEIILVNDGSKDYTYDVICNLAENDTRIKVIDFSKNFGQHSALLTGLRYAVGNIIVCLDDDGQTPAIDSIKLIKEIEKGNDVVFAKYSDKKHGLLRNVGSSINAKMTEIMLNKPKNIYVSSFFACKEYIAKEVIKYTNPYPYLLGLLLRSTDKLANIDVDHRKREYGKSGYSIKKLVSLWLNGFTAFSIKPLRISMIIGFIVSIVGIVFGIIIIINKITKHINIVGYSSIMASILFIGGTMMIILGIVGEYIGRIYISINNSPQSVIRETRNIK